MISRIITTMTKTKIIIPTIIRDAIYMFISKNRYKWFGKKDSCIIPSKEIEDRFL